MAPQDEHMGSCCRDLRAGPYSPYNGSSLKLMLNVEQRDGFPLVSNLRLSLEPLRSRHQLVAV